jgi:hypothetical protein
MSHSRGFATISTVRPSAPAGAGLISHRSVSPEMRGEDDLTGRELDDARAQHRAREGELDVPVGEGQEVAPLRPSVSTSGSAVVRSELREFPAIVSAKSPPKYGIAPCDSTGPSHAFTSYPGGSWRIWEVHDRIAVA